MSDWMRDLPTERELEAEYDFIVCGAGSSGSVVARRLAENPAATVRLLEAGSDDLSDAVKIALRWPENLGTSRSWAYVSLPERELDGPADAVRRGMGGPLHVEPARL
jgi:choline dehydrogenase